jgi:hypothetical protein
VTINPAINESSPPGSGGRSSADALKQIAVFRFCEEVLHDRSAGGSRAWLWQVKGKVAAYCRKTLEHRLGGDDAAVDPPDYPFEEELSDFERRQLLQSHPLLSDELPGAAEQRRCPDWLTALRSRVARYVASLRESQGSGHDN